MTKLVRLWWYCVTLLDRPSLDVNGVPEHVGCRGVGNWTRCGIGDQDAIYLEPDEEDEELEDELTESAELARAGLERSL